MKNKVNDSNRYWMTHLSKVLGFNKDGNKYVNPIRKMGASMFAFDALEELGINEWHEIGTVCEQTERLMRSVCYEGYVSYWDSFVILTQCKDAKDRLTSIVIKLQSVYGKRLKEIGCRVDVADVNGTIYLRLNTKTARKSKNMPIINKHQKTSFMLKFINSIKNIIALVRWY